MASFIDKIGKSSQTAMQKIKDTSEITKLNEQIAAEQRKQDVAYCEIGKAFVRAIDAGEQLDVESEPLVALLSSVKECSSAEPQKS